MIDIEFEKRLQIIANRMEYPRTPDIAGSVTTRLRSTRPRSALKRFAWSLTIVLVLLSSLMLIPTVRAAVIEFIQIGIVRIFPRPAEPTPEMNVPPTATPGTFEPSLIPLLEDISGRTELAAARQIATYPLLLPAYPPQLGLPEHVYVQDAEGVMTILVWTDDDQPERVTMSLHFIPSESWAIKKMEPTLIQETEVKGLRAVWTVGPYPLRMFNGDLELVRLIDGHVLIWADGDITYRLETDLPLEEALKIAESLEPMP